MTSSDTAAPDDRALLGQLMQLLELEHLKEWREEGAAFWDSPEGWKQTIVRPLQRSRDFFRKHEREDLLEAWTEQLFHLSMRSFIPYLRASNESVSPELKERADRAQVVFQTWREELGPQAWAQELTRPGPGRRHLSELLSRPGGLDWALQALKDGANPEGFNLFPQAIHQGREDVVQALLVAGADPNASA